MLSMSKICIVSSWRKQVSKEKKKWMKKGRGNNSYYLKGNKKSKMQCWKDKTSLRVRCTSRLECKKRLYQSQPNSLTRKYSSKIWSLQLKPRPKTKPKPSKTSNSFKSKKRWTDWTCSRFSSQILARKSWASWSLRVALSTIWVQRRPSKSMQNWLSWP